VVAIAVGIATRRRRAIFQFLVSAAAVVVVGLLFSLIMWTIGFTVPLGRL